MGFFKKLLKKVKKFAVPALGILAAPLTAGMSLPATMAIQAGIGGLGAALGGGNILKGALGGAAGAALGGIAGPYLGSTLGVTNAATQAAINNGLQSFGASKISGNNWKESLLAGGLGAAAGYAMTPSGGASATDAAGKAYDYSDDTFADTLGNSANATASTGTATAPSSVFNSAGDVASGINANALNGSGSAIPSVWDDPLGYAKGSIQNANLGDVGKALAAASMLTQGAMQPQQEVSPQEMANAANPTFNAPLPNTSVTTTTNPYQQDWFTYGQRPEFQFVQRDFTSNKMAKGGRAASVFGDDGQVSGPGKGQDDFVPAMLSADEYVIPADVVSALGDGSSQAGGAVLDEMIAGVRTQKGTDGKHPPKAKSVFDYVKSAKKKKSKSKGAKK